MGTYDKICFVFLVFGDFKDFLWVFSVQNKTRISLIHFFIEKVEKILSIKTLKNWKTETQTETENHGIYTHIVMISPKLSLSTQERIDM